MLPKKTFQNLILFLIFLAGSVYLSAQNVKVGLPLVPGILYRDDEGEPAGFYVDLLEALSEGENWSIEWIDGSWHESWQNLANGKIDIIPIAAVTAERLESFDFLETTIITTWSELYIHRNSVLHNPLELNQKRIGLVKSDNNSRMFTQFIKEFGVDYEPVFFENHEEAIKALIEKDIFAFAGPSKLNNDNHKPFKSAGLHYKPENSTMVFRKDFSSEIRHKINLKLMAWKSTNESPYHNLMLVHQMNSEISPVLPLWLVWLFFAIGFVVLGILVFSITLRHKLRAQANKILEIERAQSHNDKINSLGHLAGGIAHDFNNMLTGIMGFTEVIMDQLESEELKDYSRQVLDTGEKASELTQQLLSFSRKELGPGEQVDVHNLLKSVKLILQHTINPKISIIMKLDSSFPILRGYSSQLQNALLNLGLNAADAMPEGGIILMGTLDITLSKHNITLLKSSLVGEETKFKPGKYLEIYFQDRGIGIDKESLRKIFEPYYTTKERGKGTGLGLPSVIGTVSLHGGVLLLQSKKGEGSLFRILVPLSA